MYEAPDEAWEIRKEVKQLAVAKEKVALHSIRLEIEIKSDSDSDSDSDSECSEGVLSEKLNRLVFLGKVIHPTQNMTHKTLLEPTWGKQNLRKILLK